MEWYHFLGINLTILVFLFCIGMPIAIAFFALNIVSLLIIVGPKGLPLISNSIIESVGSFSLAALPLFIMMGNVLYESDAVGIMFDAVDKWIGNVRARLHLVAMIVATIFSAIGGAAMGTVAMMGASILPEMNRRGYNKELSAGAICAGASLSPIIPPSTLAIVVAMLANVSIAKLLIAGVIPGLILAGLITAYILIRVHFNTKLAPSYDMKSIPLSEKLWALLRFFPFSLIIFLVVGLILLGVATPTESAATGVLGALIVSALFRRLTVKTIVNSALSTMRISGMVLIIMASAQAFSQVMALSGAAQGVVNLVNNISVPPMVLFAIMNLITLFLCCFMDQISLMMIFVPIYVPIITTLHFDPIWFWLVILINITLGGITPPFGYVLFTLKGTTKDLSLQEIYRSILPFVLLYIFAMLLVAIFPPLATWLPSKL
jgi:tripartite ATP-independent transporter DctM subunit